MFDNAEDKILHPGHVWHGAAVAWHNDLHSTVTVLPATNARFAAIILGISDESKILVISLYAPTSGKDDEYLECLSYLEEFLRSNTPSSGSILIGTDSNCSDKSSRRRKLAWSEFCRTFSLEMKKTGLPTFHHNNGSSTSSIDYFVSVKCQVENLKHICTLETPLNLSSHDAVLATIPILKEKDSKEERFSHTYIEF